MGGGEDRALDAGHRLQHQPSIHSRFHDDRPELGHRLGTLDAVELAVLPTNKGTEIVIVDLFQCLDFESAALLDHSIDRIQDCRIGHSRLTPLTRPGPSEATGQVMDIHHAL